jgi:hypothetical protein
VSARAASIDPQLTEVEQHAVVEMALVDVSADLALVCPEILCRALRVEHEPVRHQVDGREVGLQSAAAELREVGVWGKPEDPLDQRREDGLSQQLLVLAGSRAVEVFPEVPRFVELSVAPGLLVEKGRESMQPRRDRAGGHQNPATSGRAVSRA